MVYPQKVRATSTKMMKPAGSGHNTSNSKTADFDRAIIRDLVTQVIIAIQPMVVSVVTVVVTASTKQLMDVLTASILSCE